MGRPIYFVGDVHLGRRPTLLAEALEAYGLTPRQVSPEAALDLTVDRALAEGARAVIFAGDLVDHEDDRYEVYAPLEAAVHRLTTEGVAVCGVAGNHDLGALPRLAARIPEFTLVGADEQWQCTPLPEENGEPAIDLLGWSFPRAHVREDPSTDPSLARALEARRPGARLLGVVHGDLDHPGSRYAPLDRARLEAVGADAFLLGHIHSPPAGQRPSSETPLGYLGSLCALDAGEPGAHGPHRLCLDSNGLTLEHLPLSPLRFERLTIELDAAAAESPETILEAIRVAAELRLDAVLGEGDEDLARSHLAFVALRCRLRGRLAHRAGVREIAALSIAGRGLRVAGIPGVIETIRDETRLALDLARLSETTTPVGQLARRILALEAEAATDSGGLSNLLEQARERIAPFVRGSWALSSGDPLRPDELRARLLAASIDALEALLETSTGADAGEGL